MLQIASFVVYRTWHDLGIVGGHSNGRSDGLGLVTLGARGISTWPMTKIPTLGQNGKHPSRDQLSEERSLRRR